MLRLVILEDVASSTLKCHQIGYGSIILCCALSFLRTWHCTRGSVIRSGTSRAGQLPFGALTLSSLGFIVSSRVLREKTVPGGACVPPPVHIPRRPNRCPIHRRWICHRLPSWYVVVVPILTLASLALLSSLRGPCMTCSDFLGPSWVNTHVQDRPRLVTPHVFFLQPRLVTPHVFFLRPRLVGAIHDSFVRTLLLLLLFCYTN